MFTDRVTRREDVRSKLAQGKDNIQAAMALSATYEDRRDMSSMFKSEYKAVPSNFVGPEDQCGKAAYAVNNTNPTSQFAEGKRVFNPSFLPPVQSENSSSSYSIGGFRLQTPITVSSGFALDPSWIYGGGEPTPPVPAPRQGAGAPYFVPPPEPRPTAGGDTPQAPAASGSSLFSSVTNAIGQWLSPGRKPTLSMYKSRLTCYERWLIGPTTLQRCKDSCGWGSALLERGVAPAILASLLMLTIIVMVCGDISWEIRLWPKASSRPYLPPYLLDRWRGDVPAERDERWSPEEREAWKLAHSYLQSDKDVLPTPAGFGDRMWSKVKNPKKRRKKQLQQPVYTFNAGDPVNWATVDLVLYGDGVFSQWKKASPSTLDVLSQYGRYRVQAIEGDTTNQLLYRLDDGEAPDPGHGLYQQQELKPAVAGAVLYIGAENVHRHFNSTEMHGANFLDEVADNAFVGVRKSVEELLYRFPNAVVVVMTLLPRGRFWPEIQEFKAVQRVNYLVSARLKGGMEGQGRVNVLECGDRFVDPEGRINMHLYDDQYFHPSKLGYDVLGKCLRERLNMFLHNKVQGYTSKQVVHTIG